MTRHIWTCPILHDLVRLLHTTQRSLHALLCCACSMKLERIYWSRKPSKLELTIFTTLTVDRLPQLREQCASYEGPLSAAVFLAITQNDREALTSECAMHACKHAGVAGRCMHTPPTTPGRT